MPGKRQSSTPATRRKKKAAPAEGLEQARTRLDGKRAERRGKMMWAHYWLLCPKCGGDMFVQRTKGIAYEVCRECHGIAIDGDELELLLEHLDPRDALSAILEKSLDPDTEEI